MLTCKKRCGIMLVMLLVWGPCLCQTTTRMFIAASQSRTLTHSALTNAAKVRFAFWTLFCPLAAPKSSTIFEVISWIGTQLWRQACERYEEFPPGHVFDSASVPPSFYSIMKLPPAPCSARLVPMHQACVDLVFWIWSVLSCQGQRRMFYTPVWNQPTPVPTKDGCLARRCRVTVLIATCRKWRFRLCGKPSRTQLSRT